MIFKINKKKGFTLIELLVAMTIVAVLMGLALVSFQGAKKTARDGKRKTDLEQLRSALEMYRADNGHYFYPAGCDPVGNCNVVLLKDPPDALQDALLSGRYLPEAIDDPLGGTINCACSGRSGVCGLRYYYRYVGGTGRYFIVGTLETETNKALVWNCGSSPQQSQECFTPGDVGAYGFKYMVCSP